MTVPSPYCVPGDLLLGDVLLPAALDKEKIIQGVADDMDAKLGFLYQLPLTSLLPHEQLLLKGINAKWATARILLSLYGEGDGDSLHAYGLRLETEAQNDLMLIANGLIDLDEADRVVETGLDVNRGPTIKNRDEESGVTMFENMVHRSEPSRWSPGDVI